MAKDRGHAGTFFAAPRVRILPVDVVFHPNWWFRHYGIRFTRDFFFDPTTRVAADRNMRRILHERFPDLGLGEKDAAPRPVVGGVLLAAGYLISGLLGCGIRFSEDAPPEVVAANLTDAQVRALRAPSLSDVPLMRDVIRLFDFLEKEFGYVEGDINWEGIQNVALNLRGHQLFIDYYENPDLARTLFDVIADTVDRFLSLIRGRTGTTSLSVNRIVRYVDPRMALHSNCTVSMISPELYETFLLPYDIRLSEAHQPYGIHYCGNDMHKVRHAFARIKKASFFDVGWGSDVRLCREALPDAFFSLRLSPVRMRSESAETIERDIEKLLADAGPLDKAGLCCINMDIGTPDRNVRKIFEVAERHRRSVA